MPYIQYIGLFLFGGLGVLARYGIAQIAPKSGVFPVATAIANIVGALLLGFLCQQFSKTSSIWIWLAVGFCGGLTTFSGIAMELHHYITQQKILLAILYGVISLVLGIIAFWAGNQLAFRCVQES